MNGWVSCGMVEREIKDEPWYNMIRSFAKARKNGRVGIKRFCMENLKTCLCQYLYGCVKQTDGCMSLGWFRKISMQEI